MCCPLVFEFSVGIGVFVIGLGQISFFFFLAQKILMLSNATHQPKSTVELGYMCPRGLTGPPAVTLTK